jgi:Spy/CpxP family protein refolding chaperone
MKKLVGEGKPLHSAVDKAAKGLKRKVGTGAEFMKELMGITGIKPTEIQERGLNEVMGMPRMTHDQFMANLAIRPTPAIREKVLSDEDEGEDDPRYLTPEERNYGPDNQTHHRQWTLPGGKNYREMLIKLPDERAGMDEKRFELDAKLRRAAPENRSAIMRQMDELRNKYESTPEVFEGVGSHFGGEPGILASMRLKDRTVPGDMGYTLINKRSGNKSQHYATAEEAQAAMQGMPESIRPMLSIQQSRGPDKKMLHLEELQSDWHQEGRKHGYKGDVPDLTPEQKARIEELGEKIRRGVGTSAEIDESKALRDQLSKKYKAVPDAPFKKNWEEMALKRLIHHAAEKGYHGIVVTPGEEQADRYSLAKHVEGIRFTKHGDNKYSADAFNNGRSIGAVERGDINKISEMFGKEIADKIQSHENEEGILRDLDLQIGGEGMKAFYDKKVPNILNSIGKKYGVKTQLHGMPLAKKGRERTDEEFIEALRNDNLVNADYFRLPEEAKDKYSYHQENVGLHHFPITEEMRKDVLANGLPLYSQGGKVHMADGGDMDQMQLEIMNKKAKKPKKPPTPLHFAPAPALSKKEIEAHAERITRQMAGLDNPNNKTLQQLAREQNLHVDIRSGGPKSNLPVIDYSKLGKNAFTVGVPGDPSIGGLVPHDETNERHSMEYPKAGEYLRGIGGEQLSSEVPMYGGYMYGGYGHPAGWASDLGASRGMFNVVQKLAKEDPSREIYGHYHKMTPESLNHAVHFLDALMTHSQLHNLTDEQRNMLNHLMREVQTTTNKKHRPYPSFPGFENPADVMAHAHLSSDMRKKIISLIGKEKYLPGGTQRLDDVIFAASHPELRNIETGAGGNAVIKFDPKGNLKKSLSPHPTYGHDIPSQTIGQTRYTTPFQILAPRSYHRAVTQIASMGKKVEPFNMAKMSIIREPIDEQYINQMGQYEQAMRKRLGYKKGGKIKKMADGGLLSIIKDKGVEEAPDMDVKAFIMPRAPMSNSFPVGGIQQPPQAPQMPQQSAPAPQGMPPQGAPAQPPSNILQMTPQGQAMNAIKPPQMKKGGSTRRVAYNHSKDTMMLELMDAKRYSKRK